MNNMSYHVLTFEQIVVATVFDVLCKDGGLFGVRFEPPRTDISKKGEACNLYEE